MRDHNIIQIETNTKIVEEKQNHQIKKSNLSDRDLNFFNEDISWSSIDADLSNTSWDMLLTDVNTDKIYKIIINICLEICKKTCSAKEMSKKTPNTQRQKGYYEKKLKIPKKIQKLTNHQTKENVLNQIKEIENNLKI